MKLVLRIVNESSIECEIAVWSVESRGGALQAPCKRCLRRGGLAAAHLQGRHGAARRCRR